MRLLLIHQAFAALQDPGGTRHFEFAHHLTEEGHQVTVIASDLSYLTGNHTAAVRSGVFVEQKIKGIRVLRARALPTLHRSFPWRVASFLCFMLTSAWTALRSGRADVVMGTTPPIFQAVTGWIVATVSGRPFLLEVRDLWPDFAIGLGVLKNPILIDLSRWLERFLYSRATQLVVNSPAYRDYLIGRGVSPNKISLIPNGVDSDMFNPDDKGREIRRQLGLVGQFVVTYAGALGLANDIPTILRAAQRLRDKPDVHFLLVGDGKEASNLKALAQQLQLPNVIFTGALPKSEVPRILAASDMCVATLKNIPMFRTTYPNKVFDYMAAGRPTILAIDGAIRQVIDAAGGGIFVPPGDDAALASAVCTLNQDRPRVDAMGKAARAYVVQHFDRRQQADQFLQLLLTLVARADSN